MNRGADYETKLSATKTIPATIIMTGTIHHSTSLVSLFGRMRKR